MNESDIIYVVPDKMGGVFAVCDNLLRYRPRGGTRYRAILTRNRWTQDEVAGRDLPVDSQDVVVEQLPVENLYAALRRVRRYLDGSGAIVANDWIELAAIAAFPVERTVFSIVHADYDYYYDLALRHEPDVDVYVACSTAVHGRLLELMPHRSESILKLRYGVPAGPSRRPAQGPLRLLYVGRIDRQKGVFDLPAIDEQLRKTETPVRWTILGAGPDTEGLRSRWPEATVRWTGRLDGADVLAEYERHDVLVLPSRAEGVPLAMLEAGAAGVVPVVSDLASGIPEVVRQGETGWRVPVGDVVACAEAIRSLAHDRVRLEQMSAAVRETVTRDWDIRVRAADYATLFERWPELRRPSSPRRRLPYGSRLDQRWLPNAFVKALRQRRGLPSVALPEC